MHVHTVVEKEASAQVELNDIEPKPIPPIPPVPPSKDDFDKVGSDGGFRDEDGFHEDGRYRAPPKPARMAASPVHDGGWNEPPPVSVPVPESDYREADRAFTKSQLSFLTITA
jgi:hypothetical protein